MNFIAPFLFEQLPDPAMVLCPAGLIRKINPAFAKTLQYSADEVEGKSFAEIVDPAEQQQMNAFIDMAKSNGSVTGAVYNLRRKDGSGCRVNWSGTYLQTEALIFCTGKDVSAMPEEHQKHLQQEHLFEALVENSFDLLAVTDERGVWLYVSESLATLIGCKREELVGNYCFDYIHPDDQPRTLSQFQGLLNGQKKIQVPPYRFRNVAGNWFWMEAIVTNQLRDPYIRGVLITGRDISDRVQAEKNAKEMKLLEGLREGEEKERSRIARDLHDEILGLVSAAKMHLATLALRMPAVGKNQEYCLGINLLDEAALQIRNTSHNLMPEMLLENGLDEALLRYCNSISNAHLQLRFLVVGQARRYSPNFELSLYRIVQELINNIVRHSKATEALVQVSYQSESLFFTVEDNGIGFLDNAKPEGMGLRSIERRVAGMNGTLEIQSVPGKGTSIYLEFQS